MSKIIFLGTAGNTTVVNKQLRSSGGIIIRVEDLQFHIDPGPGALSKAIQYGVNPAQTTAVLVSHNHLNHCNDINLIVDAMTHSGIEQRGLLLGSKSAVQATETSTPTLTKYHQNMLEKIIPMEKNHKVAVEIVEINALPALHTDPTAIGFKLFCPKFTLSYTGDTALTDELMEALVGTDILILNTPFPGIKGQGHSLDSDAAIKILTYVRPKLAVLTHFGPEMLKADPLWEAREIQRITGIQTIAASDGLMISPDYAQNKSPVKGYS